MREYGCDLRVNVWLTLEGVDRHPGQEKQLGFPFPKAMVKLREPSPGLSWPQLFIRGVSGLPCPRDNSLLSKK